MSFGRRSGAGRSASYGEGRAFGSHSVQCNRSLARSNIVSEQIENSAGAGEDPNGKRVSRSPMKASC